MGGTVFVTRELPPSAMARLRGAPEVGDLRVNPRDRPVTRDELLAAVAECDCLVSQLVDRVDADLLARAPRLRLVANYAVGFNNVDVAAATARGIPVTNTPEVLTEATADLTFALLLALARRVVETDRCLRAGDYSGWAPMLWLGQEVHDKTLGIVGFGRIGAAVARRAQGFGMRLLYCDPREKPEAAALGASRVELEVLLREADFVSLHCNLDETTRHLLDGARLASMKPSAFLINVSRGPVVDEGALVEALRAGTIAGAALDVYEDEPRLAPGLAALENAVLVPHIGSATLETREAMAAIAVDNVLAVLRGERPPTCVNPEVLS